MPCHAHMPCHARLAQFFGHPRAILQSPKGMVQPQPQVTSAMKTMAEAVMALTAQTQTSSGVQAFQEIHVADRNDSNDPFDPTSIQASHRLIRLSIPNVTEASRCTA